MSSKQLASIVTQSFCEKPKPDDEIFKLIPGCKYNTEYNPVGNSWCGYYAIAFAFLFPSQQELADISPIVLREMLATTYIENKPIFQQSVVFPDFENDLTMEPEEGEEGWRCTFDVICFAALVFCESFLYKNWGKVEEDGSIVPPSWSISKTKHPDISFITLVMSITEFTNWSPFLPLSHQPFKNYNLI